MAFPISVKIVEVSPRDGLQNEAKFVPTENKIEFINQLSDTGLSCIEVTSFVSPKWIPQLADNQIVFEHIQKKKNISYPVLIPNVKGFEDALTVGVKEIAVFTTSSETFSKKNTNCSVSESIERIKNIIQLAKHHTISVRGYLSCVLGCPFEGEIAPEKVVKVAEQLFQLGCNEISLGDTIGVGTPFKVQQLLNAVMKAMPASIIAVHFHDTYGQALANIYAALECGISIVDSSVSGLGGCPYANGATGNVATEEVVYMLNGMGIETGIDLQKLINAGRYISACLNRQSQSKVNQALCIREN